MGVRDGCLGWGDSIRGARLQRRRCSLFAFSGRGDVKELEVTGGGGAGAAELTALLDFLASSFEGGTDVGEPLRRALALLEAWPDADILLVTDGEIPKLDEPTSEKLKCQIASSDLEVHGLLVGPKQSATFADVCTTVHVFDDWNVVKKAYV